ncbi:hypothetical protein PENTCL1PPCAC_17728 [Pristionchus entomophagus]|uniref:Gamma tubulin complex component C-terminal domain-containing protein n=1 Tax=Pristionchus entomophagus TaxID=358040 RepID=A0AAV5TMU3_9BILA|nr:hypothetical protein PENTCL1PPCAC_17728 [Pristionchus entomophagus]
MDEISKIFLGKFAGPREKIKLMGDLVVASIKQPPEKSDEEIKSEIIDRFERLGKKDSAATVSYLEDEISSEGYQSMVYFLYRLSLTLEDREILKENRPVYNPSLYSFPHLDRNDPIPHLGEKTDKSEAISPDDGCDSGRDESPSIPTRLPSGHLTSQFITHLKTRTRANPMQRECIEVPMSAVSSSLCDALMGKSTFIFRIQNELVTTVSPLVISNQSISQTRVFLRPIILFLDELLRAEQSLLDFIGEGRDDLSSQLCIIVLDYLKNIRYERDYPSIHSEMSRVFIKYYLIREEALYLFYIRPFPCPNMIRINVGILAEKGDEFISLSSLLLRLRDSSCVECIDCLVSSLCHESIHPRLSIPILDLLRFALTKTLKDADDLMLSGEISHLGLIVERMENGNEGKTYDQPYIGGRDEGEKWRKNYGIRVAHGKSIDRTTADEIMAEGKLALMRLRDPSLVEEYSSLNWNDMKEERDKERKKRIEAIQSGVTVKDIKEMFRDSIKWVRTCGDRSIFLSRQISLVANSLEIVWQVFLLGDRVSRIPNFDNSMMSRFRAMRDAIAAFPLDHLLALNYKKKKSSRSPPFITLHVSGALSIVVSSSNITIYTEAHKLLSKLSQVYHQISEAYLCLPPLRKGSDHILRGQHKAIAEITHWVGKLCGHFCTQVHEVVWKQTSKEVLSMLPSFDVLFSVHRKALKDLAIRLFLQSSSASLSQALHSSVDASSEFARSLENGEWERAAVKYTDFIESAQMFTHGLMVGDDPLGLRRQLLFLIDPNDKFSMDMRETGTGVHHQ